MIGTRPGRRSSFRDQLRPVVRGGAGVSARHVRILRIRAPFRNRCYPRLKHHRTEALSFTDPALPLRGALVQGIFAGTGAGYVLNFTSTSGNGLLQRVTVGALAVEGLAGN